MGSERQAPVLKLRKVWLLAGAGLIMLVVYLSLMHNPPKLSDFHMLDKLEHISAYGFLMFWFGQIFWRLNQRIMLAIGFVTMGIFIEIMQGMQGFRVFEYADMLANTTGVVIGWGLAQTALKKSLLYLEQLI